MTLAFIIAAALIVASTFFCGFVCGRGYETAKPESSGAMPNLESVDPWLAHFREYRAAHREESLATVYERWRRLCGYHAAVAAYVAQMGVYDPIYVPPGSAVS